MTDFVMQDQAVNEGDGTICIRGTSYSYQWIQRYWKVLGQTDEQNKAMGLMFELKLPTGEINSNGSKRHLVSWGKTLEEALTRIEHCVCAWLDRKNSEKKSDTP